MKAGIKEWWDSLVDDPAIVFFRDERNFILKTGPPKVGQIARLGGPEPLKAEELYYYEAPVEPATVTVERHLNSVDEIVKDAETRFETATLRGRW
jgi:hypothetical protein